MKNLPIYEAVIGGENEGLYTVSLVDLPAVESNFLYFSIVTKKRKEKEIYNFKVEDNEQRIVTGVLMRADFPIYRRTADGFEYYIRFSPETIEVMTEKFLADGLQNKVNLMHNSDSYVDGVFMKEIFIKDTERGISPKGFEDIEDGSLFATYKVLNDEVWNSIKDGTFAGFSIEIVASAIEIEEEDDETQLWSDIYEGLKRLLKK